MTDFGRVPLLDVEEEKSDKEIFDKINAIKTNIWQSTQRRNGIGADDLIK